MKRNTRKKGFDNKSLRKSSNDLSLTQMSERLPKFGPGLTKRAVTAPILPLALGQAGNTSRYARLWAEGLSRIYNGEVMFRDENLREAFWGAMKRGNGG